MFFAFKDFAKKIIGPQRLLELRRAPYVKLLSGHGIEIGALHVPLRAPHLNVRYVDRMTKSELVKTYPELNAKGIVDTDIIADAETLTSIEDSSQDFVIANHVIEHMRNPIGALLNWQRVLRPGGRLYLAAPDRDKSFDINRPLTTNDHLLSDYLNPSNERDRQAFVEFATEVSCKQFNQRPLSEAGQLALELEQEDYSIHFHVWNFKSFTNFLQFLSFELQDWQFKEVASRGTKGEEFIWVLEKAAASI